MSQSRYRSLASVFGYAVLILALLAAVLFIATKPASAANPDTFNYAGRPLSNSSAGQEGPNEIRCQMLAYGKVNGQKVIFTANHCIPAFDGRVITSVRSTNYGVLPTSQSFCAAAYDLCFIWLQPGNWPTNPSQIYAGTIGWANNSYSLGHSGWSCANIAARTGTTVYAHKQSLNTSGASPKITTVAGLVDGCQIDTTLARDFTYRDSGTPLMTVSTGSGALVGIGTDAPFGFVQYTSTYAGINALNTYWLTHGLNLGAKFCSSSAC